MHLLNNVLTLYKEKLIQYITSVPIFNKFTIRQIAYLLFATLLLTSCLETSSDEARLEHALEFAGDNRNELERVISHYDKDPEKQEAAKFLIRNMPRWYSYEGWQLDSIKPVLSYIANTPNVKVMTKEQRNKWRVFSVNELKKVYDCHVITSDYLIKNIDRAFFDWKNRPWNRTLSFTDFCEYLLPYRIGNEPLSDWRPVYEHHYAKLLDSLYHGNDVLEACKIVNRELLRQGVKYNSEFSLPHIEAVFLLNNRIGYCRENCDLTIYAMRASGIPVARDFFIVSPDYQHSHQWVVLRDTTGQTLPFGFGGMVPRRNIRQSDGRKKGKVYRFCYAIQPDHVSITSKRKVVPLTMADAHIKDVTAEYFGQNSVNVPIDTLLDNIYLGVFTTSGWQAVDYGERKVRNAVFHNIEPGVIYQPLVYNGGNNCQPAGFPFLFAADGKNTNILEPKAKTWHEVSLRRKMSLVQRIGKRLYEGIIGTRIEADNTPYFTTPHLLYEFCDTLCYCNVKIHPHDNGKTYRYLRYTTTDGKPINFADISVYEDTLCQHEISMDLTTPVPARYNPQYMNDHDMMTAFSGPDDCTSIVFRLSKPTRIGCIDFYPQNDANFILPGDTYELFYQNGTNGWVSLGRKIATGETVDFLAPDNVLLWLRDITQGKEEQVFIYENGRQYFVYDIK